MILLDANLLLYAYFNEFPLHHAASGWLEAGLNGVTRVGFPLPTCLAFVRIASNPRVFARAASVAQAWQQIERWLAAEPAWIPLPGERHAEILGALLRKEANRSDLVPDAHLAALALEHGLTLCSTDRDFARFAALRWENPLEPSGKKSRKR